MSQRLGRIRRIIFCIKMYLKLYQAKTGQNGGQKGAILGKNDRLGGISPVDMWYLACGYVVSPCGKVVSRKIGKSLIRLRFSDLGCMCGISRGRFFFKRRILRFSLIHCIICIRVVCTYITYITFIFFLIILPRRIYNAVFF